MSREPIDRFAAAQSDERKASVREGSKAGYDARRMALGRDHEDTDALRRLAGAIKQHVLDHLDEYLERSALALEAHGVSVHFAADATSARDVVTDVLRHRGARRVVKTKTMLGEEIDLGAHLESRGFECVETDLGEFVVQLAHDRPSHIVKPIIHQSRREVARTFEANGLGDYDDTPEVITRRAREHLRRKYLTADAAITGANFVSAESGRLVLVTNEGNSRFCLAATRCHVALVGIEKLVPRDRDLAVFLNLLARSATGQHLTVYTEFLRGPRGPAQPDGPDEVHVVFVDNGRSEILGGDLREVLRCIRCGACLNVCPVYRQASGHAYRSVYGGPIGAVVSPLLGADRRRSLDFADLPRASTLCGACHEVCPVDIPLEELLVRLRDRGREAGAHASGGLSMAGWSLLASRPAAWRAALAAGAVVDVLPRPLLPGPVKAWGENHALPPWRGGRFRAWLAARGPR